jgi:hypothetical protein
MILMVLGLTLSLIHIYHPDRRITKVAAQPEVAARSEVAAQLEAEAQAE